MKHDFEKCIPIKHSSMNLCSMTFLKQTLSNVIQMLVYGLGYISMIHTFVIDIE